MLDLEILIKLRNLFDEYILFNSDDVLNLTIKNENLLQDDLSMFNPIIEELKQLNFIDDENYKTMIYNVYNHQIRFRISLYQVEQFYKSKLSLPNLKFIFQNEEIYYCYLAVNNSLCEFYYNMILPYVEEKSMEGAECEIDIKELVNDLFEIENFTEDTWEIIKKILVKRLSKKYNNITITKEKIIFNNSIVNID